MADSERVLNREQIELAIDQIRSEISDIIDDEAERQFRIAPSIQWLLSDPLGHFNGGHSRRIFALIGAEAAYRNVLKGGK